MKQIINVWMVVVGKILNGIKVLENKADQAIQKIINEKEKWGEKTVKPFPLWITPDGLTLTRLWCVLPIIFFILTEKNYLALCFYAFGVLLDFFDGVLARHRKKETELGAKLDAIVDKIFFGATLITLFLTAPLFLFKPLFWIIISTESILIFLGAFGKELMAFKGLKRKMGANNWGKIKFALYSMGIFLLFFNKPLLAQKILWMGVCFACASILSHTFKNNQ